MFNLLNLEKEMQKEVGVDLNSILNNLNLIVISTNEKGEIVYISPYTTSLIGFEITNELKDHFFLTSC